VQLWAVPLDVDDAALERHMGWLSPDEQSRAARLRIDVDRRRFIVARGALRAILGGLVDVPPQRLRFRYDARGKPSLASGPWFSASRSGGLALVASTWMGRVGVDVERIRTLDVEALAACACSPRERAALRALPAERSGPAFLALWTRKEAYLKGTGQGLSRSPECCDAMVPPKGWDLRGLRPAPGYVGAVAVETAR
jgi:4'-phosphopantetheinyl transferase